MEPRTKASLLWGLIGALTFLVLLQAYQLATNEFAALDVIISVTVGVGIVTAAGAQLLRPWIQARLD